MIYKEICINHSKTGINRNWTCTKADKLNDFVKKYQNKEVELYTSYYDFYKDLKTHLETHNCMTDFKGDYILNEIILDIDLLFDTYDDLLKIVKYHIDFIIDGLNCNKNQIKPYFSGTGFHIHIPNIFDFKPSNDLPLMVRKKLLSLFPRCDTIYNNYSLIRLPNTWNRKSKLYKIPLSIDEITNMNIDEIKFLAKKPRLNFE